MQSPVLVNLSYIVASILFIFGLKMLGRAETARRGNMISALGMLIAIVVTLLDRQIIDFKWIAIGLATGAIIGGSAAKFGQNDRHARNGGPLQRLRRSGQPSGRLG